MKPFDVTEKEYGEFLKWVFWDSVTMIFKAASRITGGKDRYSREVGEDRFGRCVIGMPVRMTFNVMSALSSREVISRRAPLRRATLETRLRATILSQHSIDRCWSWFRTTTRGGEILAVNLSHIWKNSPD